MTTRKALFAYHLLFFTGVVGTLAAVAPPLAALPAAFGIIYCGLLAVGYLFGWATGWFEQRRLVRMLLACWILGVALGAMGGPVAGTLAGLLGLVSSGWTIRSRRYAGTPGQPAGNATGQP